MKNALHSVILLLLLSVNGFAQQFSFPDKAIQDSTTWSSYINQLAKDVLNNPVDSNDLFRVQLAAGRYEEAITTIKALRKVASATPIFIQHEFYARAAQAASFNESFSKLYTD